MLENTRRRPALVPAPCPYPPCISRHRPAPVRVIMRRPRGEQPLEGGKGCPPPGHRPRPARASETSRSSPPFAPRPWALGQTGKRIRDAGVATCNTAIICTAAHVCLCHTVVHSRCVLPAAPLQALPSCQRAAWQLCQAEPCVSWPTSTGPSCPTQMKASHNRGFTVAYLGAHLVLR